MPIADRGLTKCKHKTPAETLRGFEMRDDSQLPAVCVCRRQEAGDDIRAVHLALCVPCVAELRRKKGTTRRWLLKPFNQHRISLGCCGNTLPRFGRHSRAP